MRSDIKIPTLLGLGVLIAGIAGGVLLVTSPNLLNFRSRAASSVTISNVNTANISDSSASIYWQTNEPTSGFVEISSNTSPKQVFQDDRDIKGPQNHKLHFVTMTKLQPDTTYEYKITSGSTVYSPGKPVSFKTISTSSSGNYQPIIGTVIDSSSQPIDEAILTLQLPGTQKLAAITKISGNFVLPLSYIGTIADNTPAELSIFDNQTSSKVTLNLPLVDQNLPPFILGQDMNFASIISPSPTLSIYDLNGDGVVNSLDRSIIISNFGPLREASKNPRDKRTDLNHDGVVDQKDLRVIDKLLGK